MSDVFGETTPTEKTDATTAETKPEDLLAEIKNAEGVPKYTSVEDALKALQHSQEHIPKLEQELASLREEIDKRMSAEAVLKELKTGLKPDEKPSTAVEPEALMDMVDKRIEERTKAEQAAHNESIVQEALRKAFGEKASETVTSRAKEMGLTSESLRNLSKESPQAVLSMFGLVKPQEKGATRLQSDVRLPETPVGQRNYAWYSKLRKEDPSHYRKLYTQMLRDAEEQGSKFYE